MAVGPQVLDKMDESKLKVLEIQLDTLLSGATCNDNRVIIAVPSGLTRRLFDKLRIRYLQAGWSDVKYTSDQRDGDYLEFFVRPTGEMVRSYYDK